MMNGAMYKVNNSNSKMQTKKQSRITQATKPGFVLSYQG